MAEEWAVTTHSGPEPPDGYLVVYDQHRRYWMSSRGDAR
jgi:hypothetical protein